MKDGVNDALPVAIACDAVREPSNQLSIIIENSPQKRNRGMAPSDMLHRQRGGREDLAAGQENKGNSLKKDI